MNQARPSSARPEKAVNEFFAMKKGLQGPDARWMQLHARGNGAGRIPPTRDLFAAVHAGRQSGMSPRSQALLSPRARGHVARTMILPSPWATNYALGINVGREEKKAAEEAIEPVGEEQVAYEEVAEGPKRGWGELPAGVTGDDIRKACHAIKEKLLDKYGQLTKAFRAIDEDGSGTVTRTEFDNFLHVINLHSVARKEVMDVLFERIDADSSDSFDFKEFTRVMMAGDVMNMASIAAKVDGFELQRQKEEAEARAALEFKAKQAGMTVEEYQAYWSDVLPGGGFQTSADMAQVARDRWGKKIGKNAQAHAT